MTTDPLVAELQDLVAHRPGIRIGARGRLTEQLEDHPPGTAYVLVEACTIHDCEIAEAILGDISGRSDLAWDFGWQESPQTEGRWWLTLKIFPAFEPSAFPRLSSGRTSR